MRALLPLLMVCPLSAQPVASPSTVRATAEAVVSARPDRARIRIGVITRAPTARQAGTQNAARTEAVLASLRQALGAHADIKTVNYFLGPEYGAPQPSGKPVITGYSANNTVQVTTDDLSKVGTVIDTATQSGANSIQSLDFVLKDERAIRAQALREAALQARANADAMASALGLKPLKVISVEEREPMPIRPINMPMAMEARATPINPGLLEVHATVVVILAVQ